MREKREGEGGAAKREDGHRARWVKRQHKDQRKKWKHSQPRLEADNVAGVCVHVCACVLSACACVCVRVCGERERGQSEERSRDHMLAPAIPHSHCRQPPHNKATQHTHTHTHTHRGSLERNRRERER